MEDLDMDINNYNFSDLLNLFKLENNFTKQELKNAKSIVYKVHPDKSGLDKEYFLFFSKAYKMILKIHQFREGSSGEYTNNDDYIIITNEDSTSNRKILEQHKEYAEIKTNPQAFNKWFNELFDKSQLKEDDGYGIWLKEKTDNIQKANNPTEMVELINKKKQQVRDQQLSIYKSFEPSYHGDGEILINNEGPQNYQSGLFSKLQYDDLKDVHENSVIPVTHDDFKNRKTFRNIDEMNRHRKMDEINANDTLKNHENIINNMEKEEKEVSINRYYELVKQDEEQKKRNNNLWSQLKKIK